MGDLILDFIFELYKGDVFGILGMISSMDHSKDNFKNNYLIFKFNYFSFLIITCLLLLLLLLFNNYFSPFS